MKKVLLDTFYGLQGVGNIVFGLFFVRGGPGGGGFAMEIIIRYFLVFSSCLSLFTVLAIFLRRESWAKLFGNSSSFLLGGFYTWITIGVISSIAFAAQQIARQYLGAIVWLLVGVSIIVLNAISAYSLNAGLNSKRDVQY